MKLMVADNSNCIIFVIYRKSYYFLDVSFVSGLYGQDGLQILTRTLRLVLIYRHNNYTKYTHIILHTRHVLSIKNFPSR